MPTIPFLKSRKPAPKSDPKKKAGASKVPDFSTKGKTETADSKYRPMVSRSLPEPPREADVIEFRHPKHGRTVRGRVTAVGEHGVTARRAGEDAPVAVPHGNITAVLPTEDYGQEASTNPADAQKAFLSQTEEGGMQATPLQVALLDVCAQFGFPIDDPTQVNYDQARKLLGQFISQDDSSGDEKQTAEDGAGATEGPQDEAVDGADPVGADDAADAPDAPEKPTEGAQDATGGEETEDGEDDVLDDPKVVEAMERLIEMLEVTSTKNGDGPDSENDDKERGDHEDDKPAAKRVKNQSKGKK